MDTLTDCLKYLNMEAVVPGAHISPSSPLRGYGQQFNPTAEFATPETVPLSDGAGDGFSWGDDMYGAESGNESDDSASSIERQPHAAAAAQGHRHSSGSSTGIPVEGRDFMYSSSSSSGAGIGDCGEAEDDDDDDDDFAAPWSSRRNGPQLRRRSSIGRVAYRWGLSATDAAEIVNNFESVQSPEHLPTY